MSGAIDVEAVRDSIDLVAVIGRAVKLKRTGLSFKGLCPFHGEKTPSFSVDPRVNRWHCFGCGESGDAIDFVMRHERVSFKQALASLTGGSVDLKPRVREEEVVKAVDPSRFLAELWQIVRHAGWSSRVGWWLEDRGIEPDAAWVTGARDWYYRREAIEGLRASTSIEVLEAAGMAQGGKLWAPLARLGDPAWAGVAVPVWRIGESFPWRWRWRFIARPFDGAPKSWSGYGNGAAVDFLGAEKPTRVDGGGELGIIESESLDVRSAHLGSGVEGASTLLLVEGEPDWWSATQTVEGRAVVMAVCGAPTRWRSVWPSMRALKARGVKRVVVCVHEGAEKDGVEGHGKRFAYSVADECGAVDLECVAKLPPEGHDLNDMLRAGELLDWLGEVIA